MSQECWRKFTVRCEPPDPIKLEELAFDVIESGAASSVITDAGVECFVVAEAVESFRHWCHTQAIPIMSDEAVIETNWHAACSELWEPIELPGLRITPITDRDSAGVPADRQLMIIPGQGFGTGHHTTTRMLLEEIARVAREEPSLQPTRIADIGSGSGILALAAATMFGVPVEGVEIEVPAVENAKENIAINHLEHLVTVKLGESTLLEGQFKLVLANIYGEVLLALRQEMERLVSVGGLLCVSGISELTALQVSSAYTGSKAFCVVNRACSGEWEMLTFRRISVRRD